MAVVRGLVVVACLLQGAVQAQKAELLTIDSSSDESGSYEVEAGDCFIVAQVAGLDAGKALKLWDLKVTFNGTWLTGLLTSGNELRVLNGIQYSCWIDQFTKDDSGEQCPNCLPLDSTVKLEDICSDNAERRFWEVYNSGPGKGTVSWSRMEYVPVLDCSEVEKVLSCAEGSVPCNAPHDGTGGIISGTDTTLPNYQSPCRCHCLGEWTGADCSVPPSCSSLDLTDPATCGGAPCDNIDAAFAGVLVNPSKFGSALDPKTSPAPESFEGATSAGAAVPPGGKPCATGYELDTSVLFECPRKDARATLSGQLCKSEAPNDCTAGAAPPCPADQECTDADMTVDNAFQCSCVAPATGAAGISGPATCTSPPTPKPQAVTAVPQAVTATATPATPGGSADTDAPDTQTPASPQATSPPGTTFTPGTPVTGQPNSPPVTAAPSGASDCDAAPCGRAQGCDDPDGVQNSVFVCTCPPPLVGTRDNAPAVCSDRASAKGPEAKEAAAAAGDDDDDDGFIIGLIIGLCVAFLCCIWLVVFCWRYHRLKQMQRDFDYRDVEKTEQPASPLPPPVPSPPVKPDTPPPPPPKEEPTPDPTPPDEPLKAGSTILAETEGDVLLSQMSSGASSSVQFPSDPEGNSGGTGTLQPPSSPTRRSTGHPLGKRSGRPPPPSPSGYSSLPSSPARLSHRSQSFPSRTNTTVSPSGNGETSNTTIQFVGSFKKADGTHVPYTLSSGSVRSSR